MMGRGAGVRGNARYVGSWGGVGERAAEGGRKIFVKKKKGFRLSPNLFLVFVDI
jgi:hypothetical protein